MSKVIFLRPDSIRKTESLNGTKSYATLQRSQENQPGVASRQGVFRRLRHSLSVLFRSFTFQASAIVIDFANLPGTDINFTGGTFNFTSASGYQFDITGVTGGVGDSVGLKGYIATGGPFMIGAISTFGPEQTAPVTGTGILHITDQNSVDLTGSIQWDNITTFGVGGILDLSGTINLTGLSYPGVNSDLAALAAAGSAVDTVSFQFVPAETLTQLDTTGGETSYSGSIAAVPEPGTTVTLVGQVWAAFAGAVAPAVVTSKPCLSVNARPSMRLGLLHS